VLYLVLPLLIHSHPPSDFEHWGSTHPEDNTQSRQIEHGTPLTVSS
jgi:hypothetical protein